jgi:hypothetical protein
MAGRATARPCAGAVHGGPRIRPRPAAPIRATARAEGRFEHGPLDVGEVHAVEYDGDPTDVSVRHRIYEIASAAQTALYNCPTSGGDRARVAAFVSCIPLMRRLSGQLFAEVRAAERPCAKYQQ